MLRPINAWLNTLALATRVQAWMPKGANDRAHEGASWLVSLVLHLAILLLLFLCRFAVSRDNHADSVGAIVTRFDAAGEMDLLDEMVFIDGTGVADERAGQDNLLQMGRDARRAGWAGLDTLAAGSHAEQNPEHPDRSTLPALSREALSGSNALDFERDQVDRDGSDRTGSDRKGSAESSARTGGTGRGKGSRTTKRRAENGQEQPANLEGILAGREPEARARIAESAGGTIESERGVNLGLAWLVRHQRADGSWSFQHGPDNPGELDCPMGATGLALLAFLGAGHTHQKGAYRSQVDLGLKYLVANMVENNLGGWLRGTGTATMYVQGIGAIALCEALSMTGDSSLRRPAQLAINYIVNAQDPELGGWRYAIPQAGDTSVLGWQIMALHSARFAELNFPSEVFDNAARFLKSVETDGGALYGYTGRRPVKHSTTAVGLLCRMYLGRGQEHPGMIRGMDHLSEWGPNRFDMYYSYYATQAMHHWGGPQWEKWNAVMRDQLVQSQEKSGDARGSWFNSRGDQAQVGGRLYATCMSILTLEVYYRYLPLYRRSGVSKPVAAPAAGAAADPSAAESRPLPAQGGK